MSMGKGTLKKLRQEIKSWFDCVFDKKAWPSHRSMVIEHDLHKGLGWGMWWVYIRLWGKNDKMYRRLSAMLRLAKRQEMNDPKILEWKKKWAQEHLMRSSRENKLHAYSHDEKNCPDCPEAWKLVNYSYSENPMCMVARDPNYKETGK